MKRYTDRRSLLKNAAIGAGTVAAAAMPAPAVAQTMADVKWRMTTSWPKSLDTLYGACEFMARRVADLSENRFQLQVFASGEIVPGLQALDAVQTLRERLLVGALDVPVRRGRRLSRRRQIRPPRWRS